MPASSLPRILLLALLSCIGAAQAVDTTRTLRAGDTQLQIAVVGVDDPQRIDLLQRWIAEAAQAPLTVAGRFPLREARVEIRQRRSDDESPVPWGQTSRGDSVRVLLYVRDDAGLDALRHDWTAVHELSHLFHPHLGERGRWLAEGLASYYQNVLRARIGLLSAAEAWTLLDAGFRRGQRASAAGPLDDLGHRRGGTMRVYWAGAAYWLEADLALRRKQDSSLDAVLGEYARCCLRGTGEVAPADFVAELDRIAGEDVFARLYARYATSTAFPSFDAAYHQLGIKRDGDALRFSPDRDAVRPRDAIMERHRRKPAAVPAAAD